MMKKGEKVAKNYYNKHNQRLKDSQQQRLNNFNQNSNKINHTSPNNQRIHIDNGSSIK